MRLLRPSLAFFAALVVACQAGAPPASEAPGAASGSARTLAVVVSGPAGAPVIGANVCAFTLAGAQKGCAETRAAGTARLHLRARTYSVLRRGEHRRDDGQRSSPARRRPRTERPARRRAGLRQDPRRAAPVGLRSDEEGRLISRSDGSGPLLHVDDPAR